MHNEGCKQSQKYAKVFSFTRELPFWSGIAEVRSTWLWWMVWRFRPKAMLGALWIWCLIRANLYNNLIYTYKYSGSCYGPPPEVRSHYEINHYFAWPDSVDACNLSTFCFGLALNLRCRSSMHWGQRERLFRSSHGKFTSSRAPRMISTIFHCLSVQVSIRDLAK